MTADREKKRKITKGALWLVLPGICAILLGILLVWAMVNYRIPSIKYLYFIETSANKSELIPADRTSSRRNLVYALHAALATGNYREASYLNAVLAREAFERSFRTLKAWEKVRDPVTGLFPRSLRQKFWNGHDNGADCLPFMLLASHYLDRESEPLWLQTLASERKLSGPLPRTMLLNGTRMIDEKNSMLLFGGAEYSKDGLIYLVSSLGTGPWLDRMEEIMQTIINGVSVRAAAGLIPSDDCEVNGDLLQVLPRLYWATGEEQYLAMAERITEAYLFEIIPKNKGLPAARWDFRKGRASSQYFRFRDHGNEIIPGLAEVYFLERLLKRPQASRYRGPLKNLLDTALAVGRNADGLWYQAVDVETRRPTDGFFTDNWGYILNAFRTFDLAEGTESYTAEIVRTMKAVARMKSYTWERNEPDGYADSIESMLYQLSQFDVPEGHLWADDEIEVMFAKQSAEGYVDGSYLDGNFVRTSLMYALYKTYGIIAEPWRKDLYLGVSYNKSEGKYYLFLGSASPWEGLLKFDFARHRVYWNLPVNYPRLNASPEWFAVDPGRRYEIEDLSTHQAIFISGKTLIEGYKVKISGKDAVQLTVRMLGTR